LASQTLKRQRDKLVSRGAAVHEIHYRDLVDHTSNTMRGICKFLQVPFTPAVTVLDRADRSAVFEGAHHNLAKSSQIVSRKERKESLPPAITDKIRRYKALWKAEAGDDWQLCQRFSETGASKPGVWERVTDRLLFKALRLWDIAPRVLFSILPTSIWQAYRRLKYKDPDFVHRHLTNKETTFRSNAGAQQTSSDSTNRACAVRLGKVLLHSLDVDEIVSSNSDELKHVATINSEIFVYAHQNTAFEEILKHTVNTIDGRILHFFCSLLYPGRKLQKRSGSDFIYNVADYASKHGERVFLLGADAGSNRGTLEVLKARCPDLVVDGYSPSFCANIQDQAWNEDILSRITSFRPTHLVVCFGPVKQEMWISQNADHLFRLGVRCAYGLGGTLDFVSGRKRRAPRWIQNAGAEWLFRLLSEPKRFGRTATMFKMPYYALKFYKREIASARNLQNI
jgi:N-acetylglucosaminyldiphosphoundecaprenol N-acetyl-beta-D-mannosaminyltransferase